MGCDISWNATETNLAKQKQAALFLNIMLKKLNWTVSDKDCSDTDVYKGFQYEYFINLDAINDYMIDDRKKLCFALSGNHDFYNKYGEHAIPKPTPRKFTGFTAHLEGRNKYKDDYYE